MRKQVQQGFTLVEMSIVLVIIGLIVGGVLVGQDLVKAAQIRAVVSQIQQYDAAVNTFRGKFDCLPGDCAKAAKFLGCNASVSGILGTNNQCDGDGDGRLDALKSITGQASYAAVNLADAFNGELLGFWSDLSLANMVAGQYTLVSGAAATAAKADTGVPSTKLKKGSLVAMSEGAVSYWVVGGPSDLSGFDGTNISTGGNNLSPTEAFGIDNKLDDGEVNTGMAVHITGSATTSFTRMKTGDAAVSAATCYATVATNAAGAAPAPVSDYNLSSTQNNCTLIVRVQGS